MWVPRTETEIIEAISSSSLEESATFDAKRDLPSPKTNSEIAKDVAAMANDGGVLIYGIGEDEHQCPTKLNPIAIVGQAERVTQIVQISIAEPPRIKVLSIRTSTDPSKGYLVVVVPASERAPHMVIVKGENRYYGRTATGNTPLGEGEVARLYERRRRFEIDRDELLEKEVKSAPLPPLQGFAYLHLVARPAFHDDGLLNRVASDQKQLRRLLNESLAYAADSKVFNADYVPDFSASSNWAHCDEGYATQLDYPRGDQDASRMLTLQVDRDGGCHLFCGRAAEQEGKQGFLFFPTVVAGNTTRFLAFLGRLYQNTNYLGMVDLGLAITGLKGTVPYNMHFPKPYGRNEYRRTVRLPAHSLNDNPATEARNLLMPLFQAMSQGSIDPFRE